MLLASFPLILQCGLVVLRSNKAFQRHSEQPNPLRFIFFSTGPLGGGIGLPTGTLALKCYRFLKKRTPEETHHRGLPNPSLEPGILASALLHVVFGCAHEKGSYEVNWTASSGLLAA